MKDGYDRNSFIPSSKKERNRGEDKRRDAMTFWESRTIDKSFWRSIFRGGTTIFELKRSAGQEERRGKKNTSKRKTTKSKGPNPPFETTYPHCRGTFQTKVLFSISESTNPSDRGKQDKIT